MDSLIFFKTLANPKRLRILLLLLKSELNNATITELTGFNQKTVSAYLRDLTQTGLVKYKNCDNMSPKNRKYYVTEEVADLIGSLLVLIDKI